jgi:hypothetical protein
MMMFSKRAYYILVIQFVVLSFCVLNLHATVKEKAYLQTDRSVYIAGESVFYKLYVLDEATNKLSDISKVGYVLLRSANANPSVKIRVEVNGGVSTGSFLLPDTLVSGVYQLVAFTNVMKNQRGQQFFRKEIIVANRYDKDLNFKLPNSTGPIQRSDSGMLIKVEKLIYRPREKVKVALGKVSSTANIAVSVYETLPQALTIEKSMTNYLKEFLKNNNEMSGQGDYLPETRGKIIRGKVIDQTNQKTIQGVTVLLSCPDSVANLQYAKTNAVGRFQMLLNDYYAGKDLFFTIKGMPANQQWKLVVEDEFSLPEKWKPVFSSESSSKDFIFKSDKIVYINKSYRLNGNEVPIILANKDVICPKVYNCLVSSVFPSDFVSLKDFSEIAVELLPMVKITKRDNNFKIRVINEVISSPFEQEPAIFLDGVFIVDINKIMGLGSDVITKIDVFSSERVFGDLAFQGLISIYTKSTEILKSKPALSSLRLKNDTINRGKEFMVVNPELIANPTMPYLKQLLFWNPHLELSPIEETGFEFYTSDNTGNFTIKVEGISEDGIPISETSNIEVNNELNTAHK